MKVYFSPENIELLYFLFPGYRQIRSLAYLGMKEKVIYQLERNDKIPEVDRQFQCYFSDYVIVTTNDSHVVDEKFDSDKAIIEYVAAKKRIKVSKTVEKYTCSQKKLLTSQEFILFVKMTCVLGRWYYELLERQERVYQLFEALRQSKEEMVKEYFLLRKRLSAAEVFSAVLTFLHKFKAKENRRGSKFSDYYLELLGSLENVINPEIIHVVLGDVVRIKNDVPFDSRVVYFLLSLRK